MTSAGNGVAESVSVSDALIIRRAVRVGVAESESEPSPCARRASRARASPTASLPLTLSVALGITHTIIFAHGVMLGVDAGKALAFGDGTLAHLGFGGMLDAAELDAVALAPAPSKSIAVSYAVTIPHALTLAAGGVSHCA